MGPDNPLEPTPRTTCRFLVFTYPTPIQEHFIITLYPKLYEIVSNTSTFLINTFKHYYHQIHVIKYGDYFYLRY